MIPGILTRWKNYRPGAGLTAIIYLGALVMVFFPFLSEPGSLYSRVVRDYWAVYNSWPQFDLGHRMMFHFGHMPLWNMLNGFGTPLLGNLQSAPFHPARLLFLLPFWKVIDIWLLARVYLSGMLAYGLLRRAGTRWHGATFAGLAWMFTGSITDYINMSYLNVDLLLPVGMWVFGAMARSRKFPYVIWTVLILLLAFLAGNPTSILYFLIFMSLYYFYTIYRLRKDVVGGWMRFITAAILTGLATAVLLLPFREFLANSWDYHPAGIGTIAISVRNLLTSFGPEVLGPESENGIPLIQRFPYMGVAPLTMAFFAVFCLRRMSPRAAFFAGFAAIFGGMVVGAMPFALINHLPLFIRTSNFRYAMPEVAFCVAMLAGLGWDHLSKWREAIWRSLIPTLALSGVAAWLIVMKQLGRPAMPIKGPGLAFLVTIAWTVVIVMILQRRRSLSIGLASAFLFVLWIMEAGVHVHYQKPLAPPGPATFTSLPAGIDQRTLLEGRIYATPGILYPDLNLTHGVMDIRDLDALYPSRYARFMSMLADKSTDQILGQFLPYNYFDIPPSKVESKLLDLMGITTILSDVVLPRNDLIDMMYYRGKIVAPAERYVFTRDMSINGDKRVTLFEHSPAQLIVDMPIGYIMFGIGIDPSRWDNGGDGVTFSIFSQRNGASHCLFTRHLDPAHFQTDRKWLDFAIPHAGGKLIFQTTPGHDNLNDWAGWGDIRSSEGTLSRYNMMRDIPIKVYENQTSLLGAFAVSKIKIVGGPDEAERALKRGLDFRNVAVVEGITAHWLRQGLGSQEDFEIGVDRYVGDRVRVTASLQNAGVIVLNDTYYPGWRAYVDGAETRIYPADLAFRAVKSQAGKHYIEFIYKPASFRIGLWVSLVSLLTIAMFVIGFTRKRDRPTT